MTTGKTAGTFRKKIIAANTEYSYSLMTTVKALRIKNASGHTIRYSFVTGQVASVTTNQIPPYYEIGPGGEVLTSLTDTTSGVLYYASTYPGIFIEIEQFV